MDNRKPLCPTCRHWQIDVFILAGKRTEGPMCERRIACFPDCNACRDYEREPGSDDA